MYNAIIDWIYFFNENKEPNCKMPFQPVEKNLDYNFLIIFIIFFFKTNRVLYFNLQ